METGKRKAIDIAKELIRRNRDGEYPDTMSNLKLQKLLYYEQGFHLAAFGSPLFEDDIEAWMFGPVVPSVYSHYERYGRNDIPEEEGSYSIGTEEEEALFDEVLEVYGQYSASKLVSMTHSESPWKSVEAGHGSIISKESMKEFFKTRLA